MTFIARKLPTAARIALGLVFFVFGLNGLLHFLPQPPLPAAAVPFVGGLASTGYFFPLLKVTETLAGALLLAGVLRAVRADGAGADHHQHRRLPPASSRPGTTPIVALILAAELYLAWTHRAAFAPLFARSPARARASASDTAVAAAASGLPARHRAA